MPTPGAMGAIASATRRHRIQATPMSYKPSNLAASKQTKSGVTPESAPRACESSQSMLTRFKQQAQETLKRQQQVFSQQVQKGIKMLKPGQKKEIPSQHFQETPAMITSVSEKSDEQASLSEPVQVEFDQMGEWVSALTQMGFKKLHIHEATSMLGGQPANLDDLLQAVVAIAASEEKGSCGKASSSSMPSSSSLSSSSMSLHSEPFAASCVSEVSKDIAMPFDLQPPLPPTFSSPPLPCMSACGSASFESADDKARFLHSAPQKLDTRVFKTLQSMGFETEAIYAAFELLGVEAGVDDFFDLLLRMPDVAQKSLQTAMDTSTGFAEVVCDGSSYEEEALVESLQTATDTSTGFAEVVCDGSSYEEEALVESTNRDIAVAIVASAIAKASPKEHSVLTVTKHIAEYPSPVRGGA